MQPLDPGSLSFEEAFRRLEETVERLESGGLPIDEMIEQFESGMALVKICYQKLEAAQARVRVLLQDVAVSTGAAWETEPAGDAR